MTERAQINNMIYNSLGERWYKANDDPVALLRAESRLRNPWVLEQIKKHYSNSRVKVLDLGCGGGFASNAIAPYHDVTGIDVSEESLETARTYDTTKTVAYIKADALNLPFENESFDVVNSMDMLEHVEDYEGVVREAARVLRKNGLFIFHTFNRNPLSGLIAIKGVEWLVKNTPKNLHLYRMFIKPSELQNACEKNNLKVTFMTGMRPTLKSVLKLIFSKDVPADFSFCFTPSLLVSYIGVAQKV